jgi:hypothetical protein
MRNEKAVDSSLPYREFDVNGDYVSNGTINPIVPLTGSGVTGGIKWRDKSQFLSFMRNYGYFELKHTLGKDSNLIDEGGFELTDLVEDGNGDIFFKNWNFNIGQTGVTYGHEQVIGASGAFFAKFHEITSQQNDSVLYTREIPFSISGGGFTTQDRFNIKFKVQAQVYYELPWVRIGWQVKLTDLGTGDFYSFYPPQGDRSDFETNQEVINDLYIDKFNSYESFDLGMFHSGLSIANGKIQVLLYFHNHFGRDFNDYADMRDMPTVDFVGKDKRVYYGDTSTIYYKLVKTIEAESEPTRIRPDDYNIVSNPQQWELQEEFTIGPQTSITSKILIDDFQIGFFPFMSGGLIDPPESAAYFEESSRFVKSDYFKEVFIGDVPDFNNSSNLYKGYFRLSDGTPTTKWRRAGQDSEELPLLQILLNDLKNQMSGSLRRLSGSVLASTATHYHNAFQDYLNGTKHVPATFTYDLRRATIELNLIQVRTGADGNPPPEAGEFAALEFNNDFKIGA